MAEFKQRQTAYKIKINSLVSGEYFTREGFEPNYIKVGNREVSRVNLIATVVSDFVNDDNSYSNITLDDGSGDIQVKAWKEDVNILSNLKLGDVVLLIGKPKQYNNQTYLVPEIIKKLDNPSWIKLRKLELEQELPQETTVVQQEPVKSQPIEEPQPVVEEMVVENVSSQNSRQKLLNSIEKLDSKEGADILEIIKISEVDEKEAHPIIDELLKEGEIYQIKPGRLKILE